MDNSSMEKVENRIYQARGNKIMLGNDLAVLYGVSTKVLMQAVQRNKARFPLDFMYQLTNNEVTNLKSQFVTSSWGGRRKLPYAFTEQGVAMLSGVLNSPRAIMVNIEIMRAFVRLRDTDVSLADIMRQIEELDKKHEKRYEMMFQAIKLIVEKLDKKVDKDPRF
jgi:hypothetical protein